MWWTPEEEGFDQLAGMAILPDQLVGPAELGDIAEPEPGQAIMWHIPVDPDEEGPTNILIRFLLVKAGAAAAAAQTPGAA